MDVVGLAEGGDELAVSLLGASLEEDAEVVHVGHALDTVERARTLAQTTDDVRLAIGLGCVERVTQDLSKRILEAPAWSEQGKGKLMGRELTVGRREGRALPLGCHRCQTCLDFEGF